MKDVYLLLGSNEHDRTGWIKQATTLLASCCGEIVRCSAIYETAAWGITDQASFLNQVVLLSTEKTPGELLAEIHHIETTLGRQRSLKWGPRTLDIDILLFGNEIVDTADLKIPHPFLHERRFTLAPLAEIAPDYMHPIMHKSIKQLLADCTDQLEVRVYE
jgi:2-amino-4-hydroxy-6-hydroxymethyldihydropteridine diphosphokinase